MKKRLVFMGAVLAVVLLAAFPGRAVYREYRFRQALAEQTVNAATNTEHISVCLQCMCDLIDHAMEMETEQERRTSLSALSSWAQDCADSLGKMESYFRLYSQMKDDSYIGKFSTGNFEVRDRCLKLSAYLLPYVTGAEDERDPEFQELLLQCKQDLLWLDGLWQEVFSASLTEKEWIAAYHGLFYDREPEFNRFLIAVCQATES
mgnify:CR=1 FL=1